MLTQFKEIKCFVFDVDGVLTDSTVLVFDDAQQIRQMNTRDGYALQLAVKKGYHVVVISGGTSEGVRHRLNYLGVKSVFLQVENKKQKLSEYITQNNINWQQVLYMGDDIPDYMVMKVAGLPCCPSDAVNEIKEISKYVSDRKSVV